MAIPSGTLTGTSAISNLVQTAYDQYVRMALRSIPVMRALADVKPVQQAMPGSSVVFSIYSDLAQATTTLTEASDIFYCSRQPKPNHCDTTRIRFSSDHN